MTSNEANVAQRQLMTPDAINHKLYWAEKCYCRISFEGINFMIFVTKIWKFSFYFRRKTNAKYLTIEKRVRTTQTLIERIW